MKPIFQLSGNSRGISVNAFEVGTDLVVAGGIRDDGFTAGEIGELEADFQKASDTAQRWQSIRPATLIWLSSSALRMPFFMAQAVPPILF
ncbi:MAG TPA: hypothetical protein VEN78_14750, partial [Bradyrhizobium sp.]|nr:hypothetical protein [Bradyrhizobium sp.]